MVKDYVFPDYGYAYGDLMSSQVIREGTNHESTSAVGSGGVSSGWSFGDNSSAQGREVTHTYSSYRWDGSKYLPYTVILNVTDATGLTNSTMLNVTVFMQGDVDGSGRVNIFDVVPIGKAWRTMQGEPDYSDRADLNNDGKVDILDVVQVGTHWKEEAQVNVS